MNRIGLISLAALTAAIGTPATAQDVTGTVNITGSVAPKCIVVPVSGDGDTFGTTVALGELAQADGTMRTDLATTFNAAAGLTARVVCTTAAPTISVDATAITAATAGTTGYDNSIDFDAHVDVDYVGGSATFSNDSEDSPLGATAIGGRLANNGSDNIAISADNFRTDNATDLLVADANYAGQIVIVIAPGA